MNTDRLPSGHERIEVCVQPLPRYIPIERYTSCKSRSRGSCILDDLGGIPGSDSIFDVQVLFWARESKPKKWRPTTF